MDHSTDSIIKSIADVIAAELNRRRSSSQDDFENPSPSTSRDDDRYHPYPTLVVNDNFALPRRPRRSGLSSQTTANSRRKSIRSKSLDVICLPFSDGQIFSIPRGSNREHLAARKQVGKITITSSMTEEEVRDEIGSIFSKDGVFNFQFLGSMPGSKKLMIPAVSQNFKWGGNEVLQIAVRNCLYILNQDQEQEEDTLEELLSSEPEPETFSLEPTQPTAINTETGRDRAQSELALDLQLPAEPSSEDEEDGMINDPDNVRSIEDIMQEHVHVTVKEEICSNIYIRRNSLLQDFMRAVAGKKIKSKSKLFVTFIGEAGIDSGGLTKEFLDILSRKICSWSVFEGTIGNFTLSSSVSSLVNELPYMAGLAVSLILCHLKISLPIFSENLIKFIAGNNNAFEINDIPDPNIRRLLRNIEENKNYDHEKMQSLRDEVEYFNDIDGEENKKKFISLVCRYYCSIKNGAHIAQFTKGLQEFEIVELIKKYPEPMIDLLTPRGNKKTLDANSVYNYLVFEYSEEGSSKFIQEQNASFYLMQWLMDCCCGNGIHTNGVDFQKKTVCLRDFLQFFTGLSEIPLFGFESPRIKFDKQFLPTANVCTSTLTIPIDLSEETFRENIFEAVVGSPEFGQV